jgi:hypothetical protein
VYRASLHCTETRRLIWGFARKQDACHDYQPPPAGPLERVLACGLSRAKV